jgi:hypothetical protein
MTERMRTTNVAQPRANCENLLVVGSVALLAGLAVADRLAAWLIGEFPTSAVLWQLRFEFLRPIAVFYDLATVHLGTLSPLGFSASVAIAAALIVTGALSRIRLARAVSFHAPLIGSLVLIVYSLDPTTVYAAVGFPSSSYAFLGGALALPILGSCLKIHAEYVGLGQAFADATRRLFTVGMRLQSALGEQLAMLTGRLVLVFQSPQRQLAPVRADDHSRHRR